LTLFSSYRFLSFALRIDLEPLFVLFTTLSIYSFLKYEKERKSYFIYLFFLFSSFASLVRGPLNILFFLSLFLYIVLNRKKELFVFFKVQGLIIYLLPQALWYGLAFLKFGEAPFKEFFLDLKSRSIGKSDPFYYYFLSLFLNFFPYFLLLLPKIKMLLKINYKYLSLYLFLIFIPLLVLSFTGQKFDKYLFFIYPFVAITFAKIFFAVYTERFVIYASFFLFILNFLAVSISYGYQIKSLKPKMLALRDALPCKQRLCFLDDSVYLFSILCEKKIPKCVDKEDINSAIMISSFPCKIEEGKKTVLTLKDPYKEKYWYFCIRKDKADLAPKD